ncbi:HD domain-containing protein [Psychrobacter aquaticus]|uniref:Metal-dependent HD superfamily phosphohydrolase n=1 Tax=Psychrobacter aquaticus CMS 56 TaxID=1354303 RepID=U4T7C2_9GAMM|nr:hypothetical protein [Psychrobacter aquaticus]ERL56036.1 hypothetical protein M917_1096 [Psychrobacter aquaticus CMS 56]
MNEFSPIDAELGNRFTLHLLAINTDVTSAQAKTLWLDIAARYNEIQRDYHTLRHIQQLFAQFDKINHKLSKPHIIALALYYHDVIYDPARSDNELKSAAYAVKTLTRYLTDNQCQYIYALIIMTATHQLDELADHQKRSDAAYLLDMDLSILGVPWPDYERYAQAIRQEYVHVPIMDYRIGRITVLERLLVHPQLYLTEYYHERLEMQARENIAREIRFLRASE